MISKLRAVFLFTTIVLTSCSSPKLDPSHIRRWDDSLSQEYPEKKAVIAHYQKGDYQLSYLAAHHANEMKSDTLHLVKTLFGHFQFHAVLIEPIPFSSGSSPHWLVEEARKGRAPAFITGGESALAAILANDNDIPFFGGEPDHSDIYQGLKKLGYTDLDILSFYVVRQIPQWTREKENPTGLFERKIPPFLANYCKVFPTLQCPTLRDVKTWYKTHLGHELTTAVSNRELDPLSDGKILTQKIASDVDDIRDLFTLKIIERLLAEYKQVAVIYGAGHFITLRKSFDAGFGAGPTFLEDILP